MKFSIPKGKYNRRKLTIPNPYHYYYLTKVIDSKWTKLESILKNTEISLTTPILRSDSNRAVSRKYSFEEISSIFINKSVGANYILKTDISRYYSSIYTHSIPWALHGKSVAKKNRKDSLLGNLLDKIIRNGQDGQTIGIPVGPDTSLIISELIGVVFDGCISNSNYISAIRYIDDYYIFFKNRSDAEKTLNILRKKINEYELELNHEKTRILEMPQSIEPVWVSRINNLMLDNNHMVSYISSIYSLIKEYPNEEVLRYALARLKKYKIKKNNWELIQSFILNSILHDASGMPLACSIISEYYNKKYGVDECKIKLVLSNIISKSKYKNCDYELVWLLWLANLMNIKLTDKMLIDLSSNTNPLIILILLSKSSYRKKLKINVWKRIMTKESLYNEFWLVAYEALVRGWLPSNDGNDYVEEDSFFRLLKSKRVRFFDLDCKKRWIEDNIDQKWLPVFSGAF